MKKSPYAIVAMNALMSWNGLSPEEAKKMVVESTYEELEGQIYATSSMRAGLSAIADYYQFDSNREQMLDDLVFGNDSGEQILSEAEINAINQDDLALFALDAIHNQWVVDNAKKFNKEGRESKRYQHAPIEMIGWKETKADLLFLEPILSAIGIQIDETELNAAYDKRVAEFFKENDFLTEFGEVSVIKVAKALAEGKEFYSSLTEQNTAQDKVTAIQVAEQVKLKTTLIKTDEFNGN